MNTRDNDREQLLEGSLIDLAVESWRVTRLFWRVLERLDAGEASRFSNQLRFFQKKIVEHMEAADLKLVSVEGQAFDPGMAATALNLGDFDPDDALVVAQMVEPIVMGPEGLKKEGTVMLRKAES